MLQDDPNYEDLMRQGDGQDSEVQYSLMVQVNGKTVFSDTYEDSTQLQEAIDAADEAVEEELSHEGKIYDGE